MSPVRPPQARCVVRLLAAAALVAVVAGGLVSSPAVADPAPPSGERATVLLNSGSRIEVTRAWPEGDQYHLLLPSGGTVVIPASQVRRVSRNAADLPDRRAAVVLAPGAGGPAVERAGGTVTSSTAGASPGPDAPSLSRPVSATTLGRQPLEKPDPAAFALAGPAPAATSATARPEVTPEVRTKLAPGARSRYGTSPEEIQRMLKRVGGSSGRLRPLRPQE